jgi:hypothetical protein|tara:strand:+ start:37 stop:285 length:249 start_codon:yes stop_codon:yes gene_type:complete
MAKSKRDLAKPLSDSKFDPADYNKDGSVSPREAKKYVKTQAILKGNKKKTTVGGVVKKAGEVVGGLVTTAAAYNQIKKAVKE